MANLVRIRNKTTGVITDLPLELYEAKKWGRSFKFAYDVLAFINEPPEVVSLRKRMTTKPAGNK